MSDEENFHDQRRGVLLSQSGTGVSSAEGLRLALARKLRDTIVNVQPDGPLKSPARRSARLPRNWAATRLELVQLTSSGGMMKAGVLRPSPENCRMADAPARLSIHSWERNDILLCLSGQWPTPEHRHRQDQRVGRGATGI